MFDGVVYATDDAASPNGLYRVLVLPAADRPPWPQEPAIRLGGQVRGWVLMETVSVGFELWRQLNRFPLQVTRSVSEGGLISSATPTTGSDGA